VFRGAGTGYTGGAVPVPGALILSLEQLDKLELDPAGKIAYCGPGVITLDLMNTARAVGLFYPPDPASCDESSLGGNVAENAGGLHCKKYGVTKDYVIGLRAVTIEGEVLCTGVYSEGDLFDLTGILLGSEGLLAAVTEIAVRLIDLPRSGPTILAAFDRPENAAQAVSDITCSGVIPSVMEYMDGDAAACSNRYEKTLEIEQAAAILLIETSGETSEKQADQIYDICRKHHASLLKREANPENAERLWKLRRNLSKAVKASAEEKISEDICVPPSRLPELVSFVAELNAEYSFRVNSYGHAGDGNLHVNFLVERPDEVDIGLVEAGVRRLFARTLELDGTLTGEHGIGLTKKEYLHLEFDPATLAHMKKIKTVFDADNLLNPGKMFT
ncbi:MAG: FAD-binding protein, partial [Candidatus Zixiibacteriota bacterium]